jgi:hypothetical protein
MPITTAGQKLMALSKWREHWGELTPGRIAQIVQISTRLDTFGIGILLEHYFLQNGKFGKIPPKNWLAPTFTMVILWAWKTSSKAWTRSNAIGPEHIQIIKLKTLCQEWPNP